MAVVAMKRRSYRGEENWFPLLNELGHARLREAFILCEVPPEVAGNLVWFLQDQVTLDRSLSQGTRRNYRARLRELDPAKVRALANRSIPGQFNSPRRVA